MESTVTVLKTGEIEILLANERLQKCKTKCELVDEVIDVLKEDGLTLKAEEFYLVCNGRIMGQHKPSPKIPEKLTLVPRVLGGKGGFGSMLRAIGAQIEKTTNRDACRDLSGRRLRDINEEQRLKKWFAKQAEREKEKQEAKKRKLDKLKQLADGPALPKIDDQDFLQKREDIEESVYEAVDEGFEHEPKAKGELTSGDSDSSDSIDHTGNTDIDKKTDSQISTASSSGTGSSSDSAVAGSSSDSTGTSKGANTKASRTVKKTMFDEDFSSSGGDTDSEDDDEIPAKLAKTN